MPSRSCTDSSQHSAFAGESRDGSGVRAFARKFVSASGRKDGLYWQAKRSNSEAPSPFSAMIGEPGAGDAPMLRNGYRYRILTAKGASAPAVRTATSSTAACLQASR